MRCRVIFPSDRYALAELPGNRAPAFYQHRYLRLMVTANALPEGLSIADLKKGTSQKVDWLPRGPKMNPVWSPDGSKIAYAGREGVDDAYSPENLELFVADFSKRSTRSLTHKTDYCLMAYVLGDCADVGFELCP